MHALLSGCPQQSDRWAKRGGRPPGDTQARGRRSGASHTPQGEGRPPHEAQTGRDGWCGTVGGADDPTHGPHSCLDEGNAASMSPLVLDISICTLGRGFCASPAVLSPAPDPGRVTMMICVLRAGYLIGP